MNKKNVLLMTVAAVAMLSSCKKMGELTADNFTVTPTPLEMVAGQVAATIDGKFPEKYMKKKAVVSVTPVLKYSEGEVMGQPATFQGEKVEGNDQTISYKVGGTYTMKSTFDYVPAMMESDLYLRFAAKLGKKEVTIPEVKVGYGVISTSDLLPTALLNSVPSQSVDAYQRIIADKQEANIKFLINQANIRNSELNSDNVQEFVEMMREINNEKEVLALKNIEVSAYASPDGALDLNTKLAEKRQGNSEEFLKKQLQKNKMVAEIDGKYTAEDWDGFKELISLSNIQDKDVIVRVLSMYKDPEEREAQIKNMSVIFTELAEQILPELRRARLTMNYEIIGRSDEQIVAQFYEDPMMLTLEEILYGATLTEDSETWYQAATELYASDYRAYNNLGLIAYRKGDLVTATNRFNEAKALNANAPEVNANLALIELFIGNVEKAETYLGKASGADGFNEMMGCINISKGSYQQAANSMRGVHSNAAALAQILNRDYAAAKATLSNLSDADGCTSYLRAILAARTNDANGVATHLKEAIRLNGTLHARALKDVEFASFASVVKSL